MVNDDYVVTYEIVPGYKRPTVKFVGPGAAHLAAEMWESCAAVRGASFRLITASGEEFGTKRPGDVHGIGGILTERCQDCLREFRTRTVGAARCPGCELVAVSWR